MTTALALGTLLALAALAFVLQPLFSETPVGPASSPHQAPPPVDAGREDPVAALREIEFDRATGKLSESDYEALKARYTARALAEMRARDAAAARADALVAHAAESAAVPASEGTAGEIDAAERLVRQLGARTAACPDCGPRPEADAVYCSSCGRYLPGVCARCGATVTQLGARFCTGCGSSLAA